MKIINFLSSTDASRETTSRANAFPINKMRLTVFGAWMICAMLLFPVFPGSFAHADMYKYVKNDGGTLLSDKKMHRKGYRLVKIYRMKKTGAYKSSPKKKQYAKKHARFWKKRKYKKNTRHKKYSAKRRVYKRLVKANGRDNGIIKGCNSNAHLASQARKYRKTIEIYSQIYGVDAELIHAIVRQESCFNEGAHSRVGAIGLMQLMPQTALELRITDPWNPEHNIQGGIKYIAQMLEMFEGNPKLAIAAYNAGPGNVNKYRGIPPFAETRHYVKKVYGEYKRLKAVGIVKPVRIKLASLSGSQNDLLSN